MRDTSGRFEFSIHPLGKAAADEYFHNGNIFIEGRENNSYSLRFVNHFNKRVLAIFGVDGLCIQTGKPAGYTSPGYVVNPGQTLNIPGWSLNMNQAAEFFFSRKEDSFVNSIGGAVSNTGVIGCMVFEEALPTYVAPVTRTPFPIKHYSSGGLQYMSSGQNAVSSTSASVSSHMGVPASDLGTGVGDAVNFNVTSTTFDRLYPTVPQAMMVIYYNTAKNLQKIGIQLKTKRYDTYTPDPFPGSYGIFSGKSS